MRRQITNECLITELRECIKIDHELHMKLFFTRFSVSLLQWFRYGNNYKIKKESTPVSFLTILNNQGETFSSIFQELLQIQLRKNQVFQESM